MSKLASGPSGKGAAGAFRLRGRADRLRLPLDLGQLRLRRRVPWVEREQVLEGLARLVEQPLLHEEVRLVDLVGEIDLLLLLFGLGRRSWPLDPARGRAARRSGARGFGGRRGDRRALVDDLIGLGRRARGGEDVVVFVVEPPRPASSSSTCSSSWAARGRERERRRPRARPAARARAPPRCHRPRAAPPRCRPRRHSARAARGPPARSGAGGRARRGPDRRARRRAARGPRARRRRAASSGRPAATWIVAGALVGVRGTGIDREDLLQVVERLVVEPVLHVDVGLAQELRDRVRTGGGGSRWRVRTAAPGGGSGGGPRGTTLGGRTERLPAAGGRPAGGRAAGAGARPGCDAAGPPAPRAASSSSGASSCTLRQTVRASWARPAPRGRAPAPCRRRWSSRSGRGRGRPARGAAACRRPSGPP